MKKDPTFCSSSSTLQKLAQRLKKGEGEAIELIYRGYFHKLLHYGNLVTGPGYQQEVEDVIQDFFFWLSKNSAKAGEIRNFEYYMFQSVRRNLQSRLSTEKKNQATHERYVSLMKPILESIIQSPEYLHIRQEELGSANSLIHQELDRLPPSLKEALFLRFFEDKSYPEIAALLSISDQAAYNYVHRAIKRLKRLLVKKEVLLMSLFGIAFMVLG